MFGSAALNIALALTLDPISWSATMSIWGIASKVALFLIQYADHARHRHAAWSRRCRSVGLRCYLNWTPTTS